MLIDWLEQKRFISGEYQINLERVKRFFNNFKREKKTSEYYHHLLYPFVITFEYTVPQVADVTAAL